MFSLLKATFSILIVSLEVTILDVIPVPSVDYRLNNLVEPYRYIIEITPYFLHQTVHDRFTFVGQTSIYFNTQFSNVTQIDVHSDGLVYNSVRFYRTVTSTPVPFSVTEDVNTTKMTFYLKDPLQQNVDYSLLFKFTGKISHENDGLIWRNYIDTEGKTKWIVVTNLRGTNARKLFPCFNEPGIRAKFNLIVSHPRNYTVYSNTNLFESSPDTHERERYREIYEGRFDMSTHMFAFIVCEFVAHGTHNKFLYTRPEYTPITQMTYQIIRDLLDDYFDFFDVPYFELGNPLFQVAAVPRLGGTPGFGNWGLIVIDENVLLFDNEEKEVQSIQHTIQNLAYLISQQWFGNLVVCKWWNSFWITEGIARYYEYFGSSASYPDFEMDKQFIIVELHYAFNNDDNIYARPLTDMTVSSPSDVDEINGREISAKAASVIRMIHFAMPGAFEKMIVNFFKANREEPIEPGNFFGHMQFNFPRIPDVDLKQFFFDWTEQVGFPTLTVTLAEDKRSVTLRQSRFIAEHDGSDPSLRYTIPLSYYTNKESYTHAHKTAPRLFYGKDEPEVIIKFPEPIEWIVFNVLQTSYYKVQYDLKLLDSLHRALLRDNWSGIHAMNRAQYVDDLLSYGKTGTYTYDMVLKRLEFLKTETYYLPWKAALNTFAVLELHFNEEDHADYGKYILYMTEAAFKELTVRGTAEDLPLQVYLRADITSINCKYGGKFCNSEIRRIFGYYLNGSTIIPVDMRTTIICAGMRDASEEDYDRLFKIYERQTSRKEKLRILYGLGCGRLQANVDKFFKYVVYGNVPPEAKAEALLPLYKENPENVWYVYLLVTHNYYDIAKWFQSYERCANLIKNIARHLRTKSHLNHLELFISDHYDEFRQDRDILEYAYGYLYLKRQWNEAYMDPFRKYLKQESYKAGIATTSDFINLLMLTLFALSCMLF